MFNKFLNRSSTMLNNVFNVEANTWLRVSSEFQIWHLPTEPILSTFSEIAYGKGIGRSALNC